MVRLVVNAFCALNHRIQLRDIVFTAKISHSHHQNLLNNNTNNNNLNFKNRDACVIADREIENV